MKPTRLFKRRASCSTALDSRFSSSVKPWAGLLHMPESRRTSFSIEHATHELAPCGSSPKQCTLTYETWSDERGRRRMRSASNAHTDASSVCVSSVTLLLPAESDHRPAASMILSNRCQCACTSFSEFRSSAKRNMRQQCMARRRP